VLEKLKDKLFVFHNAKFDIKFINKNYDFIPEHIFDTMVAEAILNAGMHSPYYALKELAKNYLDEYMDKTQRDSFFLEPSLTFTDEQLEYAAQDAIVLPKIYAQQDAKIKAAKLDFTASLEFNFLPVVAKMELVGVGFDVNRLLPVLSNLQEVASEKEKLLYEIAEKEFNPRSPKQVVAIFQELSKKLNKPWLAVSDSSKDTLKFVKHPLAKAILEYREANKIISSFGETLISKIDIDGRIHSNFNQLGAATGRLSSSDPNMQQIPHEKEFRVPFVAAPGYMFVTSDFSQIELRLAGYLSGEDGIINEYMKPDADLHRITAANIYQISPEEVTKEQRSHGKTGNFSALYGSSAKGLATKQAIDQKLAEKIVAGFWNGYPKLQRMMYAAGNQVLKDGYTRTITNRVRYFEMPSSTDPAFGAKVASIKRSAFNTLVQSFAADIMKYAMILVDQEIGDRGRIVLTVHDEMGVEVLADQAEDLKLLVKDTMEKAGSILVRNGIPITANAELEDSWTK